MSWERERPTWPLLVGLIIALVGAASAALWHWPGVAQHATGLALLPSSETPPTPRPAPSQAAAQSLVAATAPTKTAAAETKPAPPAPSPPAPTPPSFDVVRVTPQGNAVIAGRAEPGAHVIVRDGDQILGEAQSDQNGEFVIVPATRVRPGGRELTLSARQPDGREIQGQESVVVMIEQPAAPNPPASSPPAPPPPQTAVADASPAQPTEVKPSPPPEAAAPPAPPVAVLVPNDGAAPRVLQAPPAAPQALALNSVDYNDQGDIRFAGSARPSSPVRVYVDNKPVGQANTDPAGQWTLTPPATVEPGVHQLRIDQLAALSDRVQSRVELPFQRTATTSLGLSPGHMVVQPGHNLWRIARQTYGAGARYTLIYIANREQIRDPNRIYPGQVFAMPGEP